MSNARIFIRKSLQNQRQQLPSHILNQATTQICEYIANTSWFNSSAHIAFYQATRGELNIQPLLTSAWQLDKLCCLPVCDSEHPRSLRFVPYFPDEPLFTNQYGILEPSLKTHPPIEPFTLDIAFLPLVAFDRHGNRLGSGKGYYDRTFAYLKAGIYNKPALVGLAYDFQEIADMQPETWDVPLQKAIVFDTKRNTIMAYNF